MCKGACSKSWKNGTKGRKWACVHRTFRRNRWPRKYRDTKRREGERLEEILKSTPREKKKSVSFETFSSKTLKVMFRNSFILLVRPGGLAMRSCVEGTSFIIKKATYQNKPFNFFFFFLLPMEELLALHISLRDGDLCCLVGRSDRSR